MSSLWLLLNLTPYPLFIEKRELGRLMENQKLFSPLQRGWVTEILGMIYCQRSSDRILGELLSLP